MPKNKDSKSRFKSELSRHRSFVPKKKKQKGRPGGEKQAPPRPAKPAAVEDIVKLRWSTHLVKRRPKISAMVILGILFVAGFTHYVYGQPVLTFSVFAILTLSIGAYLFPITYTLSDQGVRFKNLLANEFRTWDKFSEFQVYPDAVQLFFPQRSLRNRVNKGFILFFENNRDEVLAMVQERLADRKSADKQRK